MITRDFKDRPAPEAKDYAVATCQALIWGAMAVYCVWALRVCVLLWAVQS